MSDSPGKNIGAVDPAMKRATEALRAGRPDAAESILLKILESKPNDVNATRLLAECAVARHDSERALSLLEHCLTLAPKFDGARYRYASLLYLQRRLDEALPQIEILLKRDPQNAQFRTMKASIVGQMGNSAQSVALLEALVREHPQNASAWVGYAHALKTEGRTDDSIAAYRKTIELQPQSGDGYWGLANIKTFRFTKADIADMKRQLAQDDLRTETRVQLLFSLGKAQEDFKDYGSAFDAYKDGNALWRATVGYDADQTHAFVETCKKVLPADFFANRHGFGHKASDPIFIVGMPRAGSTLIEQILASHSQIEGTMELPNIPALARKLNERGAAMGTQYPDVLAGLDARESDRLGREYLNGVSALRALGRTYFIDKMPTNYAHIALIHLILPNARIVDARRHPMACCFSNYKHFFERGQHFTFSLTDLGQHDRDYRALMAHWNSVLPGKVHSVVYEDLVSDPETEVRRLLDYLGVPFEEQCLRFYETERAVRTSSSEQVRQRLYTNSVDQWKHFEPWLGPLKEALGPIPDNAPNAL